MLKIPFGKTGFNVSRLRLRQAPAAYLKADREPTGKFLNDLLDRGMNFIDTAANYPGFLEEFLGQYIGRTAARNSSSSASVGQKSPAPPAMHGPPGSSPKQSTAP